MSRTLTIPTQTKLAELDTTLTGKTDYALSVLIGGKSTNGKHCRICQTVINATLIGHYLSFADCNCDCFACLDHGKRYGQG